MDLVDVKDTSERRLLDAPNRPAVDSVDVKDNNDRRLLAAANRPALESQDGECTGGWVCNIY